MLCAVPNLPVCILDTTDNGKLLVSILYMFSTFLSVLIKLPGD